MATLSSMGGMSAADQAAIEAFRTDVLEESLKNLVLVRFTAEWCGPCKQLAPMLDKAIAEVGQGRVKQVPIDIDQNQMLAGQFRIQSVPTVYAFIDGKPVDGFMGVRPESELKSFIGKLLTQLPPTEDQASLEAQIEAAEALLQAGQVEDAANAFATLLQQAPDNQALIAGYVRALLELGQVEAAAEALAIIPEDQQGPAVQQARAALELAQAAASSSDFAEYEARIAADPADHQARIDLANALFASGRADEAADHLLQSISADREWNEGAARAQLLKLIEAKGLSDPWSIATRRKLSAVLFS